MKNRESNRASMPGVAAIVDEYRALFPDLKVVYASENGVTVGKRGADANAFQVPANYFPGGKPKAAKC